MTDTLTLPVNGKDYTIPSPPAKIGLALQASWVIAQARRKGAEVPGYAIARAALYDNPNRSMDEDALSGRLPDGTTPWEQMLEDDVPLSEVRRAARAAYIWIVTGDPVAARMVMDPEAPSEAGGSDPKAGTPTAAATKTRKRASTTGTTSRPKSTSGSAGKRA